MKGERRQYELCDGDLEMLLDACKPVPAMFISGGQLMGASPQENANSAWKKLGEKLGFEYMSVEPVRGKEIRFFTAINT